MKQSNPLSSHLRDDRIPQFSASHLITEDYNIKHAIMPHMHKNELEMYYVYSGSGRYMVDNKFYDIRAGDVVICNAGILHGDHPTDLPRVRSYSISMTNVALADLPDNYLVPANGYPVLSTGMLSKQIGELFHLIYLLSSDDKKLKSVCSTMATSVLLLIYELLRSRERHDVISQRSSSSATADRVRKYLDIHYREPLTLKHIGETLHINEYYISHVFKKEFDIPPMQYVMQRRIGEAQALLTDTDMSIGDIADHLSFSSVCHFNTMFNKYVGTSPGKYRSTRRKQTD